MPKHGYLVVGIPTPLKNISHLGWLNSQYMEKYGKMFQTTNQIHDMGIKKHIQLISTPRWNKKTWSKRIRKKKHEKRSSPLPPKNLWSMGLSCFHWNAINWGIGIPDIPYLQHKNAFYPAVYQFWECPAAHIEVKSSEAGEDADQRCSINQCECPN